MFLVFDGKTPISGKGTYVSETAIVIGDVRIGNDCYIGHGAIIRGDYGAIEIGDETSVEEGAIIHAPPNDVCRIGSGVIIGHGAIVHSKKIGNCVLIGMGAVLSIRSEIGDGSVVAEGCIVKRKQKVEQNIVVGGNPAKKIREVSKKERDFWEYSKRLYVDLAHKYLRIGMEKTG